MKVCNFISGPGVGKSTYSAMLFSLMKQKGVNCELVNEFAKMLVWSERKWTFNDQLYITAKQNHKLEMLRGKVSHVITDSPILLGLVYQKESYFPSYSKLLLEIHNSYDNINIFLRRQKKYNPIGRNQNEEEAKKIDYQILQMLMLNVIPYHTIDGDSDAPAKILELLNL